MPKIDVDANTFFTRMGKTYTDEQLEELLVAAKGELDGKDEDGAVLKIELNDTNRPDLWSTSGLIRQLKTYEGAEPPFYDFFSSSEEAFETGEREVIVELAIEHLLRGRRDGLAASRVERAELHVGFGAGLLDHAERAHYGDGLTLPSDGKILQRALRLGAPVAVRGDLEGAEAVGFGARVGHGQPS